MSVGDPGGFIDVTNEYNYQGVNYLQIPQQRYLGGALGHFEINEHADAYTQVGFSSNDVNTKLAPLALFFQDTYFVNLPNNPFISAADSAALTGEAGGFTDADGNTYVGIGRRLAETGGRVTDYERQAWQVLVGLRGNINGPWNYDTFLETTQTDLAESYLNDASIDKIQQALLVVDNGNGPECVDPSDGCVPLNVWSSAPGALTPEALQFIGVGLQASNRTRQTVYGGSITGDLGTFRSPWADANIGLALGYEHRQVSSNYRPDYLLGTGQSAGFGASPPVKGQFDVDELFTEVNVPIVENVTGIYNLSAEAGYRWSNYSSAADTTNTWKAGLSYSPIQPLRFRGMYQRAVRAPDIDELYSPATESAESASDPCSGDAGGTAAVQALCEATGVPTGFYAGGGNVPAPPAGQIQGFIGGNPNLVEETSDTWTFGTGGRAAGEPGVHGGLLRYLHRQRHRCLRRQCGCSPG